MTEQLKRKIRETIALARPDADQIQAVIDGWEHYFQTVGLTEAQQAAEFDGIMRARVRAGVISAVAPSRLVE